MFLEIIQKYPSFIIYSHLVIYIHIMNRLISSISLILLSLLFVLAGCDRPGSNADQSIHQPSTEKRTNSNKIVVATQGEYDSLNTEEKRLADLVQASVNALDALKDNPELENNEATIHFERDPKSKYTGIIIAAAEDTTGNLPHK